MKPYTITTYILDELVWKITTSDGKDLFIYFSIIQKMMDLFLISIIFSKTISSFPCKSLNGIIEWSNISTSENTLE